MQQRLKSLQRLLSVQKDLHRLAEWRLASLGRQLNALQEEQKRLITCLDDDRLFTLAYTGMIADRLHVLEGAKQRFKQERDEQTRILVQRSRRVGQIEHVTHAVAEQCRRNDEKRELDAVIDAAINSRRASFR